MHASNVTRILIISSILTGLTVHKHDDIKKLLENLKPDSIEAYCDKMKKKAWRMSGHKGAGTTRRIEDSPPGRATPGVARQSRAARAPHIVPHLCVQHLLLLWKPRNRQGPTGLAGYGCTPWHARSWARAREQHCGTAAGPLWLPFGTCHSWWCWYLEDQIT